MTDPTYVSRIAHGAASEMIACAYLLGQGYHVFRAVSASGPHALPPARQDKR